MAYTVPSAIQLIKHTQDVLVHKHPLTTGLVRDSLTTAVLCSIETQTRPTEEVLVVSNTEPWGPISVARVITESQIIVSLPFQWKDGTAVQISMELHEVHNLSLFGNLPTQTFQCIQNAGQIVIVPSDSFAVKEFAALKASENTRSLKELTSDDHGKVFMLQRNAKKDYQIATCLKSPGWIGTSIVPHEWATSRVEDTGLQLSRKVMEGVIHYFDNNCPREQCSNIGTIPFARLPEHIPMYEPSQLEIVLKAFKAVGMYVAPSTDENILFVDKVKEAGSFHLACDVTTVYNSAACGKPHGGLQRVEYGIGLIISRHRTKYTAAFTIANSMSDVPLTDTITCKTLEELYDQIQLFLDANNLQVVTINRRGKPGTATIMYGLYM